jgi:hypothetical protein
MITDKIELYDTPVASDGDLIDVLAISKNSCLPNDLCP